MRASILEVVRLTKLMRWIAIKRPLLILMIETIGFVNLSICGIVLSFATIWQWHLPSHIILFEWNKYNEAYIEYLWSILAFPCSLYAFKVTVDRLINYGR